MMGDSKVPCRQCGRQFVPKSKVNVFCDRQCQLDYRAARSKEETQARAETGFAWDPVRPAPHVKVTAPHNARPVSSGLGLIKGWKTAAILPDQQFGYRRYLDDGTLDPFHDPRAVEVAEQIVEAERPDKALMLGDLNDLPTYGRWEQEPEFVGGVQPGLDRASIHVATISELADETVILKGNHDQRIERAALANALASAGLRRARRRPGEYPVQTMEFLLGLEEMRNVRMVGGYPAGAHYINENLAAIHGRITGANIGEKTIASERVSVVHGHTHSYYDAMRTFNHHGRPIFVRAHSPGCLCRIDGAVPSRKSGRDPFGRPMTSWEDWQQGLTIVRYLPGDGRFTFEHVPIFEGWAMHRGQVFESKKAVNDPELHLLRSDVGGLR